jgi:regulator of protease activity HflC (stomatin/prohibitin superfamily)
VVAAPSPAILRAQGDREAAVLRAQADRQAAMLRSEGEAQAITTVFNAIHAGQPDQALLAYQYMQMLPAIARGDANKVWVVPSELNDALKGLGSLVGKAAASAIPSTTPGEFTAPAKIDVQKEVEKQNAEEEEALRRTVEEAIQEAEALERPRPDRTPAFGTPEETPALPAPNGQYDQYEQDSQPNLTQ